MRAAFALRIISGKNIYNFAILENLRIFQNCLFTGGVVTESSICSAAFCESAALRETNPLRLTAPCLRGSIPLFAKKNYRIWQSRQAKTGKSAPVLTLTN